MRESEDESEGDEDAASVRATQMEGSSEGRTGVGTEEMHGSQGDGTASEGECDKQVCTDQDDADGEDYGSPGHCHYDYSGAVDSDDNDVVSARILDPEIDAQEQARYDEEGGQAIQRSQRISSATTAQYFEEAAIARTPSSSHRGRLSRQGRSRLSGVVGQRERSGERTDRGVAAKRAGEDTPIARTPGSVRRRRMLQQEREQLPPLPEVMDFVQQKLGFQFVKNSHDVCAPGSSDPIRQEEVWLQCWEKPSFLLPAMSHITFFSSPGS